MNDLHNAKGTHFNVIKNGYRDQHDYKSHWKTFNEVRFHRDQHGCFN